jgi:pimeloyl-ACP methyl ester carboxylesterase
MDTMTPTTAHTEWGIAYHPLIHFEEIAEGGHFAAWEQPGVFSQQMRTTFPSLR